MITVYEYEVKTIRPEGTTRENIFLRKNNFIDGLLFVFTTPQEIKTYSPVAHWRIKNHIPVSSLPVNEETVLSAQIKIPTDAANSI